MHLIASPVGAFGTRQVLEYLTRIEQRDGLSLIVMGWPIGQQGQLGPSTDRVITFTKKLEKAFPDVSLRYIDERFTSVIARQRLAETGMKKKKRQEKERVDAEAACIILQEYLDQGEAATMPPAAGI